MSGFNPTEEGKQKWKMHRYKNHNNMFSFMDEMYDIHCLFNACLKQFKLMEKLRIFMFRVISFLPARRTCKMIVYNKQVENTFKIHQGIVLSNQCRANRNVYDVNIFYKD